MVFGGFFTRPKQEHGKTLRPAVFGLAQTRKRPSLRSKAPLLPSASSTCVIFRAFLVEKEHSDADSRGFITRGH